MQRMMKVAGEVTSTVLPYLPLPNEPNRAPIITDVILERNTR